MRNLLFKRILMNEADASPGNGAVAQPAVSAQPAAAQTAPALDADALLARFASVVDERIAASEARVKNATFAELRKGGHLKQEKAPEAPAAPPAQPSSVAPTMSDITAAIERDRVLTARITRHALSEAQAGRMRAALANVLAESLPTEADAYLADMGLVKPTAAPPAATTATQATEAPKPPAAAPAAPTGHGLPTQGGIVDLFSLSAQQIKELGPMGIKENLEKLVTIGNQMAGIPQRPKPPSQR